MSLYRLTFYVYAAYWLFTRMALGRVAMLTWALCLCALVQAALLVNADIANALTTNFLRIASSPVSLMPQQAAGTVHLAS